MVKPLTVDELAMVASNYSYEPVITPVHSETQCGVVTF